MPVFFEKEIKSHTKLAIWQIEEEESFFLQKTILQKNITHPHKRLQHLAGRYLLSYLFPDFPQESILIADTRKPYIEKDVYHFSVSHSGNYAAAIVSKDYRVGIDVELFSEKVLRVRDKFLNEKEISQLKNKDNLQLITTLWSAKESVYKWWSFGGIDFSENILFNLDDFHQEGNIDAVFRKDNVLKKLEIPYQLFNDLSLTFVMSNE